MDSRFVPAWREAKNWRRGRDDSTRGASPLRGRRCATFRCAWRIGRTRHIDFEGSNPSHGRGIQRGWFVRPGSAQCAAKNWRRGRDSNPRYGYKPYTHFPGVLLKPLGHLSGTRASGAGRTTIGTRKDTGRTGFTPGRVARHDKRDPLRHAVPLRTPTMIEFGHATHIGLRRTRNEDTCYADPATGLFLVADGLGGHHHGALAAALARDGIMVDIRRGHARTGHPQRRPHPDRPSRTLRQWTSHGHHGRPAAPGGDSRPPGSATAASTG